EISTVNIPIDGSSSIVYYKDTLAGSAVLTFSATGLTSANVTVTVSPAAPVNISSYTVSTTKAVDSEQATGYKNIQTVTVSGNVMTLVEFPFTDTNENRIVADGRTRGVVRVEVKDIYGNPISGEVVSLLAGMTGLTVSPSQVTTGSDGKASFQMISSAIGDAAVSVRLNSRSYNYGSNFTVRFKYDDREPPTITNYDATTLVSGDYIDGSEPINIRVVITDEGMGAVGVDPNLSSIGVVVTNSVGSAVMGTTTLPNCNSTADCTVTWTPAVALSPGAYVVTLTIKDRNDNPRVNSYQVVVENKSVIKDVLAGPGLFDPRSGVPMQIGFQASKDGTVVRLEIFSRSGEMIYTAAKVANAGYNTFEWTGRDIANNVPGNGIYLFKIIATINGQTSTQTGKLAIFKQ
ncbi:MAG TPA: Ig-like domain-containing protein, partial [bacterium]|nr:Ig-like domain-containing protein [bacterium]